jgi:hypothetical protein
LLPELRGGHNVLFFIHLGSRRVHIAGMTPNPDRAWVAQQARNTAMYFGGLPERPTMLLRDRDQIYSEQFDAVFKAEGVEVKRVGPRAPNMKECVAFCTSCKRCQEINWPARVRIASSTALSKESGVLDQ